jgi:Domain of unknown function (DUF4268)
MLYKLKTNGPSTTFVPVKPTTMLAQGFLEKVMEDWLAENPYAVLPEEEAQFLVFCQEEPFDNVTDILALDEQGAVIVIEVKRGQTPRSVIAQALEYAADVSTWSYEELNSRAAAYFLSRGWNHGSLLDAGRDYFGDVFTPTSEAQINRSQRLFIVGEGMDPKIVRTAQWLMNHGVDIGCVSYTCYRTEEGEVYLEFTNIAVRESTQPGPEPDVTPQALRRQAFWQGLLERATELGSPYLSGRVATTSQWLTLALTVGIPGCRFGYQIWADNRTSLWLEIRLNTQEENKKLFDHIFSHKEAIERDCGSPLTWDRRPDKFTSVIYWLPPQPLSLDQEDNWANIQEGLVQNMERFVSVILPYLAHLSA